MKRRNESPASFHVDRTLNGNCKNNCSFPNEESERLTITISDYYLKIGVLP